MALVLFGVAVSFEVGELEPGAVGHSPSFLLFVVLGAELGEKLFSSRNNLRELNKFPSKEDSNGVFAVEAGMLEPISDGTFCLAASPSTPIEDLEDRALKQGCLRPWLRFPDDFDICSQCHVFLPKAASSLGSSRCAGVMFCH